MKNRFITSRLGTSLLITFLLYILFGSSRSFGNESLTDIHADASIDSIENPYQLTIYVVPSTEWLGWNSPLALMKNTALNKLFPVFPKKKKRAIGHVFIELTDGYYRFLVE